MWWTGSVFMLVVLCCGRVESMTSHHQGSLSDFDTVDSIFKQLDDTNTDFKVRHPRDVDNPCLDRLSTFRCRFLTQHKACQTHPQQAKHYCPRTCGFCASNIEPCVYSEFGCCKDGITPAKAPHEWGCPLYCEDSINKRVCEAIKKSGYCIDTNSYYLKRCAQTCGFCRPCIDKNPYKCHLMAVHDLCESKILHAFNQCRKTCKKCGESDPCYGHQCSDGYFCHVGHDRRPFCACHNKCNPGDYFTGPVCGRDGKTYNDLCRMRQTTCSTGNKVTAKHFGKCGEVRSESKARSGFSAGISRCTTQTDAGLCAFYLDQPNVCFHRKLKMMKYCPHACGFCDQGSKLSLSPPCEYSKHGCCLDGEEAVIGEAYEGCSKKPECRDRSSILCSRHLPACGMLQNREKMMHYCPKSCNYC